MNSTRLILAAAVALFFMGCGDDSGGSSDGGASSGGNGGGASGVCSADNAAMACGDDCSFDPATIDCNAACANIKTVCESGDCDAECQGMVTDTSTCAAACEGTKTLSCTNLVMGCYAMNTECNAVGTCVNDG